MNPKLTRIALLTAAIQGFSLFGTITREEVAAGCPHFLEQAAQFYKMESEALKKNFRIDVSSIFTCRLDNFIANANLERQVEEVARLVAWLYRQMPVSNPDLLPFRYVEIIPNNLVGWHRTLELVGDTLIVRMGYRVHTFDRLRRYWQGGYQFEWNSTERKLWPYANPSGFLVTSIKKAILIGRGLYETRIQSLLVKHRKDPAALREAIVGTLTDTTDKTLAPELTKLVEEKQGDELVGAVESLLSLLKSDLTVADFLSQLRFSEDTQNSVDKSAEISIWVWGSIYVVGNFHAIRVTAGYGPRTMSIATSTFPLIKKLNVWLVFSFIGVYTVDVIDISAFAEKLYLASVIEAAFRQDGATGS